MNIFKSTEVRTVNAVNVEPVEHFFFHGVGLERVHHNDGQPQVLNARRSNATISGRMTGIVKMVRIAQAIDWYSLRSIGKAGNRHTVYVKGDTLVVLDGKSYTLRDLYASA